MADGERVARFLHIGNVSRGTRSQERAIGGNMSIEKKSLINTLKTTKKANVASSTPSPTASHKMSKNLTKHLALSKTTKIIRY